MMELGFADLGWRLSTWSDADLRAIRTQTNNVHFRPAEEIKNAGRQDEFLTQFGGGTAERLQETTAAKAAKCAEQTAAFQNVIQRVRSERGEQFDAGETPVQVIQDESKDAFVSAVQFRHGAEKNGFEFEGTEFQFLFEAPQGQREGECSGLPNQVVFGKLLLR